MPLICSCAYAATYKVAWEKARFFSQKCWLDVHKKLAKPAYGCHQAIIKVIDHMGWWCWKGIIPNSRQFQFHNIISTWRQTDCQTGKIFLTCSLYSLSSQCVHNVENISTLLQRWCCQSFTHFFRFSPHKEKKKRSQVAIDHIFPGQWQVTRW